MKPAPGVGLIAAAFSPSGAKHDPVLDFTLLSWPFCTACGCGIKTDLLSLTLQGWWLYPRLASGDRLYRSDSGAFFFLTAAGFRCTTAWKNVSYVMGVILGTL